LVRRMDKELESYVELTLNAQTYRSGIFVSWWDRWMRAVAFYRSGVDRRGAVHARRRLI
jgi:hypothetical protein